MAGSANLFNYPVQIPYQKVHCVLLPHFLKKSWSEHLCVFALFYCSFKSVLGAQSQLLAVLKMGKVGLLWILVISE